MRDILELVRKNIRELQPYSSARDEFHGKASVFLDANESPYNEPFNRYPDPLQWKLKEKISRLKKIDKRGIFLGNGSDEPIDLLIRIFCEPGIDHILAIEPSYGMYKVAASINNVACRTVKLREDFSLDADAVLKSVTKYTKIIFLCSPNNPTGNMLDRDEVYKILENFRGIVVIDEAYIDFALEPSFIRELSDYPNIVVLQTLSKAWGAAAIRLGMAFAYQDIIQLLNKVKYPYNINLFTQEYALQILGREKKMRTTVFKIIGQRMLMESILCDLPFVKHVYPSSANFLLVKMDDANAIYNYLVREGIIVRNRNLVTLCHGCLRITIGTHRENSTLMQALFRLK